MSLSLISGIVSSEMNVTLMRVLTSEIILGPAQKFTIKIQNSTSPQRKFFMNVIHETHQS